MFPNILTALDPSHATSYYASQGNEDLGQERPCVCFFCLFFFSSRVVCHGCLCTIELSRSLRPDGTVEDFCDCCGGEVGLGRLKITCDDRRSAVLGFGFPFWAPSLGNM